MTKRIENMDITGKIGPLYPQKGQDIEWPMYSFDRAAYLFWNGFAKGLAERGLSQNQIKNELQSKGVRWLMDQQEGRLEELGRLMAKDYEIGG